MIDFQHSQSFKDVSVQSHLKAFHSSLSNGFSIKRGKRKDADLILSRAQQGESKGFFFAQINLSASLKMSQFHLKEDGIKNPNFRSCLSRNRL